MTLRGRWYDLSKPLVGLALAAGLMVWLWHFTVDDALITARYAHHIACGFGHRFNMQGGATDGVTPLYWPWLLSPFARSSTLSALQAAKVIGAGAWLVAAWALARTLAERAGTNHVAYGVAVVTAFLSPAVAAWSVSGMETGVCTCLAVASVLAIGSPTKHCLGSLSAGILASFRPELLPWAIVIGTGHAAAIQRGHDTGYRAIRGALACLVLACVPFALVCAVRLAIFDSVAPLAVRSKPSDLRHGLVYAAAALLVTGPPAALILPSGWRFLGFWPRVVCVGAALHVLVVVAVGGDWMPMSRLLVPILPTLSIVVVDLAKSEGVLWAVLRAVMCIAGQGFVCAKVGAAASHVGIDRARLIDQIRPSLRGTDRVAAVDVGWLGAAFDGVVVDLAGATDPAIASFSGGHTSKSIPSTLLHERDVTKVVLLMDGAWDAKSSWEKGFFARRVESQLARQQVMRSNFSPARELGDAQTLRYLLLIRAP